MEGHEIKRKSGQIFFFLLYVNQHISVYFTVRFHLILLFCMSKCHKREKIIAPLCVGPHVNKQLFTLFT